MKLAISATGSDLSRDVDPRFGRAKLFIIYDTESGQHASVSNQQNLQAAQGAGIQAAQQVVNQGVSVVLTGHCGPKAFQTLKAAEIQVCVGVNGPVAGAIEQFKRGELKSTETADVEGHW